MFFGPIKQKNCVFWTNQKRNIAERFFSYTFSENVLVLYFHMCVGELSMNYYYILIFLYVGELGMCKYNAYIPSHFRQNLISGYL